jgi:hypothetical protein
MPGYSTSIINSMNPQNKTPSAVRTSFGWATLIALGVAFASYLLPQKDYVLELSVRSEQHAAIVLYMNLAGCRRTGCFERRRRIFSDFYINAG